MPSRRFPSKVAHLDASDVSSKRLTRIDDEQSLCGPTVPRPSLVTGTNEAARRSYSHPDLSAPSTAPKTRKRHRNHRRYNPASQTSVADTGNTSKSVNDSNRTQNVDSDRSAKRARKGASQKDGSAVSNHSTANTQFNRSANAATGYRTSARPGGNSSQVDVNQRMKISNLSGTGGTGGAGGSGGLIGGPGGNGAGTVISMNFVFNFPR
ncbi:hypothetical protein MSAN_01345900 [Mycena sanguinolenta]|uniref:Uncharacterized protein n=1 Tax=Mycena sanguinolenta TaxID=230812 RepID=A0A8H6YF13_9AGAR|nr:hypothetical protein MSAN_01345900 [Mycena sanguinolenta]